MSLSSIKEFVPFYQVYNLSKVLYRRVISNKHKIPKKYLEFQKHFTSLCPYLVIYVFCPYLTRSDGPLSAKVKK